MAINLNKQISTTENTASNVFAHGLSDFIITPEGRAIPDSSGNFTYQYYLKDHLGNTRVTYTQKGDVLQDNNYYPFGLSTGEATNYIADACLENKYLYNGKELDDDLGVGWYDYGARFYDPQLGRFHTIDKLSEKYYPWSPFVYVGNNPIKRVDPNGNDWWDVVNGSVRGVTDNLAGLNTRASYNPTDPADYNGALDKADKVSMVAGGMMVVGGTDAAAGGAVAAVATGGTSLVASGAGLLVFAEGAYMMANAAENLKKGNHYVEDDSNTSGTTEDVITRKDPGADGATSEHIIEKDASGNTVSKTHKVTGKDGKVKHQHQDHVSTQKNPETGKKTTRQFPDERVKYPKIDKK